MSCISIKLFNNHIRRFGLHPTECLIQRGWAQAEPVPLQQVPGRGGARLQGLTLRTSAVGAQRSPLPVPEYSKLFQTNIYLAFLKT